LYKGSTAQRKFIQLSEIKYNNIKSRAASEGSYTSGYRRRKEKLEENSMLKDARLLLDNTHSA